MRRLLSKVLTIATALTVLAATFMGCAGSGTGADGSAKAAAEGQEAINEKEGGGRDNAGGTEKGDSAGKTLIIASGQSAATLDPVNAYDGWYSVRYGICQTLTKMNDDLSISGWIAEDGYTSSIDHKAWKFRIRENVCFSNGNKLSAEIVKASLENVFENGTRGEEYFTLDHIDADGQELTIYTRTSEPILPNKLADPLFCIIDTTVDNSGIAEKGPIGTGPFICESFDSVTKECIVKRNENYWGGVSGNKEVKCPRIDFVYTEDQSALTLGLTSGDFDAVYNVSMTDIDAFEENGAYRVISNPGGRTAHGFMNWNRALGDKALRRAIMQAIDKETICSVQLNGQYLPGKTLITPAADYGYDEIENPDPYDPENAKKLLDDAGYLDRDGDGFREAPDGSKLELGFVYYTGRPEQQVMVEASQMQLAEIGIKLTPELQDTQTVINRLKSGDFDLLCMSINVMNCADPENHLNTYFKKGGSYNAYGYDNEELNATFEKLAVTSEAAEGKELVK